MTPYILLLALVAGSTASVVELSCSDNATCIDSLAKELARNLRQRKTVKLFDLLTIEPLDRPREARSLQGPVARFLSNNALSFDWNDFSFRLSKPEKRDDAIELEVFEGRGAKDVPEVPKKSSSKVEEEAEVKRPKGIRRRRNKKVLQALIPMVFGMKSAGTVIFAMAVVTALTIKAFMASKLALAVTVGMAAKRLYESYGVGVGLQNHPYLYSQYPIDFPSASSHAYSVSGVSPQFASPEMYNPTALGTHSHTHEMLQQQDASAAQSAQAPQLQLANATRAAERWDGKSKLFKFFEPLINGVRSVLEPITSLFFGAPATFRGMTADVKATSYDEAQASTIVEEKVKKPREILVPQPRNIAQRKMAEMRKRANKPKKYTQLNVDMNNLKSNKDYTDYIKTKKYKYNYPSTYFYPRVKFYSHPSPFPKPNNYRAQSYRKPLKNRNFKANFTSRVENKTETVKNTTFADSFSVKNFSEWQPIIVPELEKSMNLTPSHRFKRFKRDLSYYSQRPFRNTTVVGRSVNQGKGIMGFFEFVFSLPFRDFFKSAKDYTKSVIKESVKDPSPPKYYLLTYDMVNFSLHVMDDLVKMKIAMYEHLFGNSKSKKNKKKKKKKPQSDDENDFKKINNDEPNGKRKYKRY